MSVPNQKIIVCDTWEGKAPNGVKFSTIIHSINDVAMSRLSPNGYKLYMYLYCNKKNFELDLSLVTVSGKTGMKDYAYHNAVKELINKGFLTLIRGNKYQFSIKPVLQPVDRKPVYGKPLGGKAPSSDNHQTGVVVSNRPSSDNHQTGVVVSNREIYTDNTTIYTNNNIGVYPYEGDNKVAREKTNNADSEPIAEVALALIVQSGKRYSPSLFKQKLSDAETMLSNMVKLTGDPDFPVWKYLYFEDEAAYRAAVEQGKSQVAGCATAQPIEAQTGDTPDSQYEEGDELPF